MPQRIRGDTGEAEDPQSVVVLLGCHLVQRVLGDDLTRAQRLPPTRQGRRARRDPPRPTTPAGVGERWQKAAALLECSGRPTKRHGHRLGRDFVRLIDEALHPVDVEYAVA